MNGVIQASGTLVLPRCAVSVTLSESEAKRSGQAGYGNGIVTRLKFFIDFILGSSGCADGMAESATLSDVQKMDELIADNEGEDRLPDLSRKAQ